MMGSATIVALGAAVARGAGPSAAEATQAEGNGFSAALDAAAPGGTDDEPAAPAEETAASDLPAEGPPAAGLPLLPGLLRLDFPVAEDVPVPVNAAAVAAGTGAAKPLQLPEVISPDDPGTIREQAASPGQATDAPGRGDALLKQLTQEGPGSPGAMPGPRSTSVMELPGIATMGGASPAPAAAPAASLPPGLEHALRATVGSPRWAGELGNSLVTMTTHGEHEGSLTLTPEHLGPLEVRISVNQHTTNVWFGAQQAETRAALVDALPRLRELFAEAGLSLGHTGVSHEAPGRDEQVPSQAASQGEPGFPREDSLNVTAHRIGSGLLDLYA